MTIQQHCRIIIYLSLFMLLFGCNTKSHKDLVILEHIYRYKENSDLTNLKWYLMYKVDRSTLSEPVATIVLLERKIMGLDIDVPFKHDYKNLDILIEALKIAKEERQVAAAEVFTQYLEKDDEILKSPILAAHIATVLYEPFDLIKANISFLFDYKNAALHSPVSINTYIKNYYIYFAELMDATEHQQDDKYEYAKLRSSATLSQLIRDGHQREMQNLCGQLTSIILINILEHYDSKHIPSYINFFNSINTNQFYKDKILTLTFLKSMVDGQLKESDLYNFDPQDNCAFHSFGKIYFYSFLEKSERAKSNIFSTLYFSEDSPCSYFKRMASKELINYLFYNDQKDNALELLRENNYQHSCSPMIDRSDLKIQNSIMTKSLYLSMCTAGYGKYCQKADSVVIELERNVDMNKKELFHFSNLASGLGIDRLKIYLNEQNKNDNSLAKLISVYQKSKARQLALNAKTIENNITSHDMFMRLKKINADKAALENKVTQLSSVDILSSRLHQNLFDLYKQKYEIEAEYLDNNNTISSKTINPKDLQNILNKENAIFIDFINNQDDLIKLTIHSDTFYLDHIELNTALKDSINMYKSLVKDPRNNLKRFRVISKYLSSILLIKDIKNKASKLIISPSDLMYDLPFESLLNVDGKYLVESYNIEYVYNISMVSEKIKRKIGSVALFAYSDNATLGLKSTGLNELYFSKREIDDISKLLPKATLNCGFACSRGQILKSFNSDIIHISTHAVSDPSNRHNNYIVLRDGIKEELFFGYDFEKYIIKADLIVLNGCETQIGKGYKGEGEFSLARSLKNSGVPNVLSTRWKVNDQSSAEIMKHFYNYLPISNTYCLALQSAQLKLIKSLKYQHPYYWAGYTIY